MKLRPTLRQEFNLEEEEINNIDFSVKIFDKKIKHKTKITTVNIKNIKKDSSTKLF